MEQQSRCKQNHTYMTHASSHEGHVYDSTHCVHAHVQRFHYHSAKISLSRKFCCPRNLSMTPQSSSNLRSGTYRSSRMLHWHNLPADNSGIRAPEAFEWSTRTKSAGCLSILAGDADRNSVRAEAPLPQPVCDVHQLGMNCTHPNLHLKKGLSLVLVLSYTHQHS